MRIDPTNPSHSYAYTDEDAGEFREHHGHTKGCKMGRTAGSAALECDTHHVCLSLSIPILLRDI